MNAALERIRDELEDIGLATYIVDGAPEDVVAFPFTPRRGRYADREFQVGLGFQEIDYPEFAPHWIHVSPAIEERHGPPGRRYSDSEGRQWVAFSRPPQDFWDNSPVKNMLTYVTIHLRRFWREA